MTSPNLGSDSLNDFTSAANAIGLAALQAMQAEDFIEAQIAEVAGPLGGIVSWVTDGLGTIIADIQAFITTGDIANLNAAAEFVQSRIAGLVGEVLHLLDALWDAMRGEYDGDVEVLEFIQNLFAPIRKLIELITGAVNGLSAAPELVVSWLSNLRKYMQGIPLTSDPADFFAGLGNVAQNLIDKIVQGLGGTGTGHTVDDVKTRLEAIGTATPATPAYVADIQDMATVPRSMVVGWDTHTISGCGVVTSQSGLPTYTPDRVFTTGTASSYVDYTPIVVDRSGVVKKLRWIVGADSSIFAIDDYRMALCAYNPATGNIEKVWDSGNIKDGVANTTTLKEVEIAMGIDQTCTPGQILFVAHMQLAPGLLQAARSFAAAGQAGIARPSTLLLDACTYRTSSRQTGIPSSIALAGMTRINNRIPWAAVSVDTSGGS